MATIRQHYRRSAPSLNLSQGNASRTMNVNSYSGPTLPSLSLESHAISGQETVKRFQLVVVKDLWCRRATVERAQQDSCRD
jgi:hypothetical protein